MELLENHPNLNPESLAELQFYLKIMNHHLQDMQRSLDLFAPWFSLLNTAPAPLMDTPAWQVFRDSLPADLPALKKAGAVYERVQTALAHFKAQIVDENALVWSKKLDDDLSVARLTVKSLLDGFQDLAERANSAVAGMDFSFLFDGRRQVFHIGYNASTEQLDPSYYDLLASEARIASLAAIAKGDVPQSHWQHLGRPVTKGEWQAGTALVERHHVRISHAGSVYQELCRDFPLG